MFKISHVLDRSSFAKDEVRTYLDAQFRPDLTMGEGFEYGDASSRAMHAGWVDYFQEHLPRARYERLHYIAQNTSSYWNQNGVGRICCEHVWPTFFKSFSNARILLVQIDEGWVNGILRGHVDRAVRINYREANPMGNGPQEMSGLQVEELPFTSLLIPMYGIYPLVLFDAAPTSFGLVIYVPDKAIEHSQMMQRGAYTNILWHLHHVSDDQWTFDGFRGPKTATHGNCFRPTDNLDLIEWVVDRTNDRMHQLLGMEPIDRQKLGMTFNRAVCDCVLATTSQLPYMAKSFLFACLDKLANLLTYGSERNAENVKWESLLDLEFLQGELAEHMRGIPCDAGEQLATIVANVADDMRVDKLSPELLRLYRNSTHGYDLRNADCLHNHSGEIYNDISLLATPLVLYALSREWPEP